MAVVDAAELLDRALTAEAELESCRGRLERTTSRLMAALHGEDIDYWTARAVNAEQLLEELERWVADNPSVASLLPDGYMARLRAQLIVKHTT